MQIIPMISGELNCEQNLEGAEYWRNFRKGLESSGIDSVRGALKDVLREGPD
jgi:hypothetical protein